MWDNQCSSKYIEGQNLTLGKVTDALGPDAVALMEERTEETVCT